jgi:hypothetical protein
MDQLGVEISKEEGFGSGLWAEIKRRHKRDRLDGAPEDDADERVPQPILTEAIAEARQPLEERSAGDGTSEQEHEVEPDPAFEHVAESEDGEFAELDFERELEELANDCASPSEPLQMTGPETQSVVEPAPEPELVAVEPEPEPEPQVVPAAKGGDAEDLRAELDAAREDLAHLHEMLADAMTALSALTAEAQGVPYEG